MNENEIPSSERWEAARTLAERKQQFWTAHAAEFRARFPDQFVAVAPDGSLVATAGSLTRMQAFLDCRGLAWSDVWVQFMRTRPLIL
jgi:pyocin large subunit-like protein